ncbi:MULTISPECIES: alpha/beta fold hydrolase [unclassified Luteococcus]|uniref:alpha/beta fold hydrolase n=1 Tax=unclassified Luteococcus TaxID=2639923 RepID=UPI00313AD15E
MSLHHTTIGDGPARVVFLHGLFGQGKNFTQIAKGLSDLATCTLVDLPNHGRSAWTDEVSYPQMAAAVAELLRELDGPVCLVGHSMGGKVAMRTALDHPDLVERLMVVDISPAAGLGSNFGPLIDAMQSLDLPALESRRQADELLSAGIPNPTVRGFLMQNLRHEPGDDGQRHWHWQMNLDLLARELDDRIAGWPEVASSYPGPVLWVAGEKSPYVRPDAAPTMRRLFPRYLLVTIKDAGHWVHSEQPENFTATLRHFLQRG